MLWKQGYSALIKEDNTQTCLFRSLIIFQARDIQSLVCGFVLGEVVWFLGDFSLWFFVVVVVHCGGFFGFCFSFFFNSHPDS